MNNNKIIKLKQKNKETGARNERRLTVLYYNKLAGFEIVHGVLDRIMQLVDAKWKKDYVLEHNNDPAYMPGRTATVLYKGKSIGNIGVLHPEVIQKFELNLPCCALEINIEPFL